MLWPKKHVFHSLCKIGSNFINKSTKIAETQPSITKTRANFAKTQRNTVKTQRNFSKTQHNRQIHLLVIAELRRKNKPDLNSNNVVC